MATATKFITLALAGMALSGVAQARGTVPAPAEVPPLFSQAYDPAPWWMKDNVITQTGYVFAEVPANRAEFSATFLSVADTAEKAQAKAIDQTRALNQALGKLGKDALRVTTSFSMRALYEEYRDKNGNRIEDQRADKINAYEVSLNMSLEVRDINALEKAYALVLAASPTSTTAINFNLQATNAQNTWLYSEAIKDAHTRALQASEAAGGRLGGIKVIDPTGRACDTDILARQNGGYDNTSPQEVTPQMDVAPPPPIPVPPAPMMAHAKLAEGSQEWLEAKALSNPFIQTPPLQRLEAKACVVYGVN